MSTEVALAHLSDEKLLERLQELTRDERRVLADVLAHLAEVDRRRLHLDKGYSSLFKYAVEVLHLSEDEAGKRIYAARAARTYPIIFAMVRQGELHLTAVSMLAAHLTADNHESLLASARYKSKRQIEELLAAHAPAPDAPSLLRRLPEPRRVVPSPRDCAIDAPRPPATDLRGASATPVAAPPSAPAPKLAPTSPDRYRLQVTLGKEGRERLLRARALLRHKNPGGDLAVVIEGALALLVDELERRKLGKRKRRVGMTPYGPASDSRASGPTAAPMATSDAREIRSDASDAVQPSPSEAADRPPVAHVPEHVAARTAGVTLEAGALSIASWRAASHAERARYIPRATRREVVRRDGESCSFVSADGRRCGETGFLEVHHLVPFARGGTSTADNLALRCRAHNVHQAVLDFGEEHVRRRVDERRAASSGVGDRAR